MRTLLKILLISCFLVNVANADNAYANDTTHACREAHRQIAINNQYIYELMQYRMNGYLDAETYLYNRIELNRQQKYLWSYYNLHCMIHPISEKDAGIIPDKEFEAYKHNKENTDM